MPGYGVIFETGTHNAVLQDFYIGPNTVKGVQAEWHNDTSRSWETTDDSVKRPRISYGVIESSKIGVIFAAGTEGGSLENLTIRNSTFAGLVLTNNQDPDHYTHWSNINFAEWPICTGTTDECTEVPCKVTFSQANSPQILCQPEIDPHIWYGAGSE